MADPPRMACLGVPKFGENDRIAMGMKHIYDKAGLTRLQRLYQRLHEPRFVSALYGLFYGLAAIVVSGNYWVERAVPMLLTAGLGFLGGTHRLPASHQLIG